MKSGFICVLALSAVVVAQAPASEPASRLIALGGSETPLVRMLHHHDLAADVVNDLAIAGGVQQGVPLKPGSRIAVGLFEPAGGGAGEILELNPLPPFPVGIPLVTQANVRIAHSPHISIGGSTGGFLLVWTHRIVIGMGIVTQIHTRRVSSPGLIAGDTVTIHSSLLVGSVTSVAYSLASRVFLAVWTVCSAECQVMVQRIDPGGQPIGSPSEVASGALAEVAWNPVTDEFGVASSNPVSNEVALARLAADGTVRGQVTLGMSDGGGPDVAVNSDTGHYVAIWDRAGLFAAEVAPDGAVVSRGLVSSTMETTAASGHALAYNPTSGTFLVVGRLLGSGAFAALELNRHGMALSAPDVAPFASSESFGAVDFAVMSRPGVAEWRVARASLSSHRIDGIGTSTRGGGSTLRLGGCSTPDPFAALGGGACHNGGWLPPGMPVPGSEPIPVVPPPAGGCVTPDPFVALGGGTCQNGGWFPPGMPLPPVVPPVPPQPGGCTTPDPFVAIGGGICSNGGWRPKG